jgi:hypothetical protein
MRARNRNLAAALVLVGVFAAALFRPPAIFGGLLVYGEGFAFTVAEPANWKGDIQSAARWGANIIFYPHGESPSAPGTIVIRIGVFTKTDEDTSKDLEADMNQYRSKYPKVAFKNVDGIKAQYKAWPRLFYLPKTFYEYVTYLNPGPEHRQLISISMNTNGAPATAEESHAYQAVIQSFVLVSAPGFRVIEGSKGQVRN